MIIVFAFYTGNMKLGWIDIPTHFAAGLFIALLISGTKRETSLKKVFILSFLVFLSWELFEISASTFSHNEFIINLFKETAENRVQDMIMDILGFLGFILIKK